MDAATSSGTQARGGSPARADSAGSAEPRQRWRVTFSRAGDSPRIHREIAEEWIRGIAQSGLPLPRSEGRPRPPLTFASPMPAGMAAEREIADLVLAGRMTIDVVRHALEASMPEELSLIDLHDVWLGAPALQAAARAADYRVELVDPPDRLVLEEGARDLLAAQTIERDRPRGGGVVRYDLRPLFAAITVDPGAPTLRIRTRFHPERGSGRPEEVVAALSDALGRQIQIATILRERVLLADEDTEAVQVRADEPGSGDLAEPTGTGGHRDPPRLRGG